MLYLLDPNIPSGQPHEKCEHRNEALGVKQSPQGQASLSEGNSGKEARCKAGHEVNFRDFRYLGHCEDEEIGTLCEGCESFVPKVSEPEPLGRCEEVERSEGS